MFGALAFGTGKRGARFLGLDLPILQVAPRRVPERRLRNEGLQTGLCTGRAAATLNDKLVNTVALCTHDTSSYTRSCSGCECGGTSVFPRWHVETSIQIGCGRTYAYTAIKWQTLPASTNKCQTMWEYFQRDPKNTTPNV
jgi:hypothetical protein